MSYTHYDAASKEFLEWGKFIAISQFELSSARARDAKPILDAITSLNRFYLVLGRDSTKRPSAKVNQVAAVRAIDSGDSGDEDHEAVHLPQALAVRAAPAAGGKGKGKGARGTPGAEACWTPSCKAFVQPRWNTCLDCNTVRPGVWKCNGCNCDMNPNQSPESSGAGLASSPASSSTTSRERRTTTECSRAPGRASARPRTS